MLSCGHKTVSPCEQCVRGNPFNFMTDYQKHRLEIVSFQKAIRSNSSSQYTNYRARIIERYKNRG